LAFPAAFLAVAAIVVALLYLLVFPTRTALRVCTATADYWVVARWVFEKKEVFSDADFVSVMELAY
jgi:hypothetical protein